MAKPTNVAVADVSPIDVELSFDTQSGVDEYVIVDNNGKGTSVTKNNWRTNASKTFVSLTGLNPGLLYTFTVASVVFGQVSAGTAVGATTLLYNDNTAFIAANLTGTASTLLKTGPGIFERIMVNTAGTTGDALVVFDTDNSTSTVTLAVFAADTASVGFYPYEVQFTKGLLCQYVLAAPANYTVSYK